VGDFGETEKPFLPNLDPFSEYFLLADFSNYFYNSIFDLYHVLKYELNLLQKSYGSFNFKNFFEDMAVVPNNSNVDSDDSSIDSEVFRKKLKQYLVDKKVELLDPGMKWYPILRRNPDTDSSFRSKFLHYLIIFLRNHRNLLLPQNTDDLLFDKVVVNFEIEAIWAGCQIAEFSETFNQVRFNNLANLNKCWNVVENSIYLHYWNILLLILREMKITW
jgi:hypothetical protein